MQLWRSGATFVTSLVKLSSWYKEQTAELHGRALVEFCLSHFKERLRMSVSFTAEKVVAGKVAEEKRWKFLSHLESTVEEKKVFSA